MTGMTRWAKFAAIFIVAGLIGIPIGCLILPCHVEMESHDCCPQTSVLAQCPFDILASAKVAAQQHVASSIVALAAVTPVVFEQSEGTVERAHSALADKQETYLQNRVLRL